MAAISEYQLVSSGAASYEQMGYRTSSGEPAAIKLLEWLAIDAEIKHAEQERDR